MSILSVSTIKDCDFIGGHIVLIDDNEVKINGRVYQINSDDVLITTDSLSGEPVTANCLIQHVYKQWRSTNSCSIRKIMRDLLFKQNQITNDVWGAVILAAIQLHYTKTGGFTFRLHELYQTIALYLGGKEEDVMRRKYNCFHPVNGKPISDMGYVRTWIQERSPCSRQRYWRANKCIERSFPLLFMNPKLGKQNIDANWMPGSHVRGDSWHFDPEWAERWYAEYKPSKEILAAADAHINPAKRGALRGEKHAVVPTCVIGTVSSLRLFA